jgi:hypothetical protein
LEIKPKSSLNSKEVDVAKEINLSQLREENLLLVKISILNFLELVIKELEESYRMIDWIKQETVFTLIFSASEIIAINQYERTKAERIKLIQGLENHVKSPDFKTPLTTDMKRSICFLSELGKSAKILTAELENRRPLKNLLNWLKNPLFYVYYLIRLIDQKRKNKEKAKN